MGATVYVDGVNQGITPTTLAEVSIGIHQIKMTKSGYQDYTTSVTVTSGTTSFVSASLSQTSRYSRGVPTIAIPSIVPTTNVPTPATSTIYSTFEMAWGEDSQRIIPRIDERR